MFLATSTYAETSINRCEQEDGTVAFQEMPCAKPDSNQDHNESNDENDIEDLATDDGYFDFTSPFDATENPTIVAQPEPVALPSRDRAVCEKTTRDAIDEIDLKVRQAKTKENRLAYLAELLDLTQQLRACKQL